ncbi:MAG: hypothetical protein ICV74_02695 [Thermoleophilia bacterium]|nr:hypothetical protein [Thermoleophilia bacterium]
MWGHGAWDWVIVALLYAGGLACFGLLGGIDGASRAFQRWGDATSRKRARRLGLAHVLPPPRKPSRSHQR